MCPMSLLSENVRRVLSENVNGLASKVSSRTWKRSVPPAVAGGCAALKQVVLSPQSIRNNGSNEVIDRRLMATHPPATAGGTDLFQVGLPTFEAKPMSTFPTH